MIPDISRYSGSLYYVKYLFMHYISLTGPAALVAMSLGAFATILGLAMLFVRVYRRYVAILSILTILTVFIGMAGTILISCKTKETVLLEERAGLKSTAQRYYDLQYGYSESLLVWFPFIIGTASAIPPAIILIILIQRSKDRDG